MSHDADSVSEQLGSLDLGNLYGSIDKQNVHGLNLTVPEDARALIKPWDEREDTSKFAESGVDDQIIIHVPFTQNVRLRSVLLKLGRGELTPRRMRMYANHSNIVDFSEAEDITPQLNISLSEGEVGVTEYPLRTASFANVHSLSIFFSDSVGGDSVRLYYVGFRGDSRSQRKEGTQKLEVPAQVAPDAKLIDRLQEKTGGQQTTAR
ncbi:galactose-binding domain-like protein [Dichomitus squalens]|uniref:Galactose-binding domain-like protein n=1 Tax=Dichomitus squalens TaxID=114155 RepID=A0A4Q9NS02_9APHY|nr:galactose-binding domain-like protein [Dichomitus squalens]TBU58583.1 galactose-binding domain-like protein [Dichomitus squalens]